MERAILVTPVKLSVGLRARDNMLQSAVDETTVVPFHFTFPALAPVSELKIRVATVGDVFRRHYEIARQHPIGTEEYRRGTLLEHVKLRVDPVLSPDELDGLAQVDYERLEAFLSTGRGLDGNSAYVSEGDDIIREALVRLPSSADHQLAQQRSERERANDVHAFHRWLLWAVAYFGPKNKANWDLRPYSVELMNELAWPDYAAMLAAALSSRSDIYTPLTDIMDGPVEGGGWGSHPVSECF